MATKFKYPMPTNGPPPAKKKFFSDNYHQQNGSSHFKAKRKKFTNRQNGFSKKCHKQNGVDHDALRQEKEALPIYPAKCRIVEEIRKTDTVIIVGETASGKTTQIPQFLYKAGLGQDGCIACTQPRRVAAITVAERVAKEMDHTVGDLVGYCVRFEDCTNHNTKIKYMTDGMLMRESVGDNLLSKYSVILLDEAHERTVHTDVLFGIVKSAQKERAKQGLKKLKIIVMSATMDVDHFSEYFNNAPVLYLEGRLHRIDTFYADTTQTDYLRASLITALQIHQEAPAQEDILVFLTGQEEIEAMAKTIKDISMTLPSNLPQLIICPLYASLPKSQQLKPFRPTPANSRKIVLSTNIAETSVTIKGIKFVVDSGKVKAKCFLPKTGLDVLAVQKISKAQAWQRAGRAGRERSGVVYRLYTEEEYFDLDEMTTPEILRCNLSSVILNLLAIGIKDITKFDFMDPPAQESITDAFEQLTALGAVIKSGTDSHVLTDLGRKMAVFPLDPKLSRIIVAAAAPDKSCVQEAINLVALLSVDSILYTPPTKRDQAAAAKRKFMSSEGDHAMLLNIYSGFKKAKSGHDWCYENFVNSRNLQTVSKIKRQLTELCPKAGINEITSNRMDKAQLRQAITYGMFQNSAELQRDNTYKSLGTGQTVHIHPSSCLFKCKPAYVVYNEMVHTSKCYIRDLCVVDPEWLLEAAPDYFRRRLRLED